MPDTGDNNTKSILPQGPQKGLHLLRFILRFLERHTIPYWLDSGTLLGIFRDGTLLPWAHNVNISIPEEKFETFLALRKKLFPLFRVHVLYDISGRVWLKGNIARIRIKYFWMKKFLKPLVLTITPVHFYNGNARWVQGITLKQVEDRYFTSLSKMQWQGREVSIPSYTEEYLSSRYGDWRAVVKRWNTGADDRSIISDDLYSTLSRKTKWTAPSRYRRILPLTGDTLKRAKRLLHRVTSILDKHDIPYWLDDGTLLGIVRDGCLIPWDNDLDISVPGEYAVKVLALRKKFLPRYFFKPYYLKSDWYPGKERSVKIRSLFSRLVRDSLHLDVFFKYKVGEDYHWHESHCNKKIESHYYDNCKKITWDGREYWIPADEKNYLKERYGPSWNTPVKEFDTSLDEPVIAD